MKARWVTPVSCKPERRLALLFPGLRVNPPSSNQDQFLGGGAVGQAGVNAADRRAGLRSQAPVGAIPHPCVIQENWNPSSAIATEQDDLARRLVVGHAESVPRWGCDGWMLL